MIDRTLTTYTFINYLIDKGVNQLELYVPLACKCIIKYNAREISLENLIEWFKNDYGLNMYRGVFDNLLRCMARYNLITWSTSKYIVNEDKVISHIESVDNGKSGQAIESLCANIAQFIKNEYNLSFQSEDIQEGLLSFFHSHDGDLLFNEDSLIVSLTKQKEGKTTKTQIKYFISKFVIWSVEHDPSSFNIMKGLSKAHAVTSIISMKDFSTYVGKMSNVVIALDTPIIFNLLELNDRSNYDIANELMMALQQQGCKFVIFNKHYEEVTKTFSSAIHLLYTKDYNLEISSRLLKYAVRNRISASQLRLKQQQLETIMGKWDITLMDAPDYPAHYSDINITMLEEMLQSRYQEAGKELDENRKLTIQNDVDVVSYIYRMRGNNVAYNLKNAKAILITTNTALAYASKNDKLSSIHHTIPVCMTDRFLSTIMWFTYPQTCVDINEKVLLRECYNNITLSDEILHKFYKDVQDIHKTTPLTEEQILHANTSYIVQELLENKTYNDTSLYTDTTAAEILEEIDRAKNERIHTLDAKLAKHENNINKLSKGIAAAFVFILWIGLVSLFLFLKFVDYREWDTICRWIFNVLSLLPALWGLLGWFGLIPSKINIIDLLSRKISNKISAWINK